MKPATMRGEDEALAAQIDRDPVSGARCLIEALAQRHQIAIDWRAKMPRGIVGQANVTTRSIILPAFATGDDVPTRLAIALHEVGHHRAPRCPGNAAPHRRPWRDGCLACEVAAWREALTLWPFSSAMFAALQDGLRASISAYPAPVDAVAAAHALMRPETLTDDQQRRRDWQTRVDRQAALTQSLMADRARLGQFACSTPGCQNRSVDLAHDGPTCGPCSTNRRIAIQKFTRATMRVTRQEMTK